MLRTKQVRSGKWRTVERFWNAKATAFFRLPSGGRIKVRYGGGWLGFDRQKQTLDGTKIARLSVGRFSLTYARIQVRVPETQPVTYDIYPGGLANSSPPVPF